MDGVDAMMEAVKKLTERVTPRPTRPQRVKILEHARKVYWEEDQADCGGGIGVSTSDVLRKALKRVPGCGKMVIS